MPSVITANLLVSGEVVYLAPSARWVRQLTRAEVAHSPDEVERLEQAAGAATASQTVVAPYAMDVALVDGCPTPLSVRETIRAAHGPTA